MISHMECNSYLTAVAVKKPHPNSYSSSFRELGWSLDWHGSPVYDAMLVFNICVVCHFVVYNTRHTRLSQLYIFCCGCINIK